MSEDPAAGARRQALAALARREHSRTELKRKLARKGHDEEAVDGVLEQMVALNYLDDTRFVEMFIRSRAERGQGPVRIEHELREKGLAQDVIDTALATAEANWIELACAALARKFPGPAADFPERARRMRFLEYRGYTRKQIAAALKGGEME